RARRTVFHFRFASIVREQLIRCRTFRAKLPLADRALRIAFNRNEFVVLVKKELTATNSAVWANRSRHLCIVDPRVHRARFVRHRLQSCAVRSLSNLANDRPFRKQRSERRHVVYSSLKQPISLLSSCGAR